MPCESPASLFLYLKWATRRGPKTELDLIVMRANKQKKKLENDKKTNKQTRKKDYLRHDEDCIPFRLWFTYCSYTNFITYVHVCMFVKSSKAGEDGKFFIFRTVHFLMRIVHMKIGIEDTKLFSNTEYPFWNISFKTGSSSIFSNIDKEIKIYGDYCIIVISIRRYWLN